MNSALETQKRKSAESEGVLRQELEALKAKLHGAVEGAEDDEEDMGVLGNKLSADSSSTGLDYNLLGSGGHDGEESSISALQADLRVTKDKYRERTSEVISLQQEVSQLRAELHRETKGGVMAFSQDNKKMNDAQQVVNSALVLAREEAAEAMDMYIKTQSDLESLRREHRACQEALEELQETQNTEIESSRWAVEAMTEATLKRADMEAQYDAILEELIEFKMKCAELAENCDLEKVKVFNQKQKLLRYAERVASLEVQINTRIF